VAAGVEQLARQQQAIGRDDKRIGAHGAHLLHLGSAFQPGRLENSDAPRGGEALHRARQRLQAATGRTVGLRKDEGDVVACGREARQSPLSELGRSGED